MGNWFWLAPVLAWAKGVPVLLVVKAVTKQVPEFRLLCTVSPVPNLERVEVLQDCFGKGQEPLQYESLRAAGPVGSFGFGRGSLLGG